MVIYENIFDAIEVFEKNSVLLKLKENQFTSLNFKRSNNFRVIETEDGKLGAIPEGFMLSSYRGENQIFPSCKPSIYRNNNEIEKIRDEIKIIDFELILEKFPQVIEAKKNNLYINLLALAQHYELNTNLIDITSDLAVAAFFSVNSYNSKLDKYEVLEDGIGVIKRYFTAPILDEKFEFIGYQIFKRPTNQHAFGIKSLNGEELKNNFENVYFKHSKKYNQKITDLFLRGDENILFPQEEILRVAKLLKKSNSVTKQALEIYCKNNEIDIKILSDELEKNRIEIKDKPLYKLSKKRKKRIEKSERKKRDDEANQITFGSRLGTKN